ncbi:MAG TPA: tripartite tricarboxylate transporter substrate-binding protein, partial [Burkholderiales bacterium]|nr:tripartite tricarboxylate transporter substrate-binding protein [Burkholderiales bacterium]
LAPMLLENLGQPLVIDNRGGAGGSIATEMVARSPADGYTLLMMAAADTMQPALRSKLSYDLERDFAPVTTIAGGMSAFVVHPSVPARNMKELIALARAQPGKLRYGSSGVGSSSHLMGELLKSMAQVDITHVPYKGSAESALATAAGHIEMSFPSVASVGPLLESGKLRVIAVTGARRASSLPAVPTFSESGLPGYERSTWFGVATPAGVHKDIITRLHAVIVKVVSTPEMKAALSKQGLEAQTNTPEDFAALIHREIAINGKLIKLAGAKTE